VLTKVVTEVAEVCDEVDEAMLEEELERRVIAHFGEPYLRDAHICEAVELELRAEGYGAARGDDGQQVYSLPYDELQRRMADGELALPGEQQMAWDQRILRDRLARGVPLGAHLTQLHQLLHEPRDPITNHDLANYGGWWPLGAELSPPSPPPPPPPFALPPAPPADHPCRCTACGHILPIFGCNDGCACMYTDPEALARQLPAQIPRVLARVHAMLVSGARQRRAGFGRAVCVLHQVCGQSLSGSGRFPEPGAAAAAAPARARGAAGKSGAVATAAGSPRLQPPHGD
jgi:hypothetical protein